MQRNCMLHKVLLDVLFLHVFYLWTGESLHIVVTLWGAVRLGHSTLK